MFSRATATMLALTLAALATSKVHGSTLYVNDLGNYPSSPATGGVLAFNSTTGSPVPPVPFASGFAGEGVTCLQVNGVTELFVADITNDLIHVYNANTGTLIMNINPGGQPNGGISLSPDGTTLYVPVGLDKIVSLNSTTGTIEGSSAVVPYTHDAFVNPKNGVVYSQVMSGPGGGNVSIVEYSSNLQTQTTFISSATTAGLGLNFATGLTFDSSGDLWLADYQNNSVYEFNSAGNWLRTITSSTFLDETFDLAQGPDGNMYATDFGQNSVTEIDVVDGTYALSTFIQNAGSKPKYLVFDSECCTATVTPEPPTLMLFTTVLASGGLFGLVVRFCRGNTTA